MKGITKVIENETKQQKVGFLRVQLGTLSTTLLWNMFTSKSIVRAGDGEKAQGTIRAGYDLKCIFNAASLFG